MNGENTRTCLVCGARFPATKEFCPVCMLREALNEEIKPAKTFLKGVGPNRRGNRLPRRFDHYELVVGKDGQPVELGRGAMGVTYKGFDVDLRCPVTLKVINERCLGDESARLRFVREARAAASVRHPNVASVFHLGRTGQNYFYAMEFVEGETLKCLGALLDARICQSRAICRSRRRHPFRSVLARRDALGDSSWSDTISGLPC